MSIFLHWGSSVFADVFPGLSVVQGLHRVGTQVEGV